MTSDAPPLIAFVGVVKDHGADWPLRIARLEIRDGDRVTLFGLDPAAAETFVHLISGAALPDEGHVRVAGQDTRDIATDTDWLLSLDRFGVVTRRAVLLETLPAAANIALPITTSIDPMTTETADRVARLAAEAGLPVSRLAIACGALNADERLRVHLARALALDPRLLLLEHPTTDLVDDAAREAFGRTLGDLGRRRGIGWVVCTSDRTFARAAGGEQRRLDVRTGAMPRVRWWQRSRVS